MSAKRTIRLVNPGTAKRFWMARAFGAHPGRLHRRLGYRPDEKIPRGVLERAAHSRDASLAHEARTALTGERYARKGGEHSHMHRRRNKGRMPAALAKFWRTHRRQGKRIVRKNARVYGSAGAWAGRGRHLPGGSLYGMPKRSKRRRRNQPAALKKYWARVKRALSGSRRSNPRRRATPMAKRPSRRRQPAALRRYWASHRHHHRRRNSLFGRSRRRRVNRTVYIMRGGNRGSRRRRYSRNPILAVPLNELVPLTAWAVGGMAGARIIPQLVLPNYNQGWTGYGLNILTTIGLSWVGSKFAGTRAAQGLLVGGFVGTAARMLADWLGGSSTLGGALSGDLDFDLGFYINNSFPLPTTGQGPFLLQPGVTGAPMAAGGIPTVAALPAAAPSASSAAATAGGGVTAAQLSVGMQNMHSGDTPNAWKSAWAA